MQMGRPSRAHSLIISDQALRNQEIATMHPALFSLLPVNYRQYQLSISELGSALLVEGCLSSVNKYILSIFHTEYSAGSCWKIQALPDDHLFFQWACSLFETISVSVYAIHITQKTVWPPVGYMLMLRAYNGQFLQALTVSGDYLCPQDAHCLNQYSIGRGYQQRKH